MASQLLNDLTCPITLELFVDPCCGKGFSRSALQQHLAIRNVCPSCNGDLSQFDVVHVAKNVLLASMIESLHKNTSDAKWLCELTPIRDGETMCEWKLTLVRSDFAVRPSLFIAVLDRSGSMSGRPGEQVKLALKHIEALAKQNNNVKLVMLSYGSDCTEIVSASEYQINGGTVFRSAFAKIEEVLRRYVCSDKLEDQHLINNVSSVSVVFMTDGCDMSPNKETLVQDFKEILLTRWGANPLSVHTVGFGQGCDRALLEKMRLCGSVEGMFRYADQQDNDDELCNKLTGIFEVCSRSSSVPITITYYGVTERIQFPVDSRKSGEIRRWVSPDLRGAHSPTVTIDSPLDKNLAIPIQTKDPSPFVFQRWVSHCADKMASDLVDLTAQQVTGDIRLLRCSLMERHIEALISHNTDAAVASRLEFIKSQVLSYREGANVNLSRLSDLRFSSAFASQPSQPQIRSTPAPNEPAQIAFKPHVEKPLRCYTRNNAGTKRNDLQKLIVDQARDGVSDATAKKIADAPMEEILFADEDGNNALMLAAYCGHSEIVKRLVLRKPDLELTNKDGETAATLAIKKRGFHHTLGVLLDAGASIPRSKAMERFAMENEFKITAEIIRNNTAAGNSLEIDETMTTEYIKFTCQRFYGQQIRTQAATDNFLAVCLKKQLDEEVDALLKLGANPTVEMLVTSCMPKKPDAPDTEVYLNLARKLIHAKPGLLHEYTEDDRDTPLIMAVRRGSLPHVKYFLSCGAKLEDFNAKGNTAFWVAAFMRYPCIMEELLNHGADFDRPNEKGNTPLYGPCCRGGQKCAEMLISRGAKIDHINGNGDSLVLICCRNGQHEVLKILLNYVDMEFVAHKAHIDGFNAIMASAEQDKAECIRVLHEYGVDLNQKTDRDNKILSGATPLHIACYYGRANAAKMLLQLGADPNVGDANGYTPLHLAVIQGYVEIIAALRNHPGVKIDQRDASGNPPIAYCRDRLEVRKMLTPPMLDVLMKLAKGGFSEEDRKRAAEVLSQTSDLHGCLKRSALVNIQDADGSTPLMQAVIHGYYDLVRSFTEMGAEVGAANACGMTASLWASWLKNQRIMQLFSLPLAAAGVPAQSSAPSEILLRLQHAAKQDPRNMQMMFLGATPAYETYTTSGLEQRMEHLINTPLGDSSTARDVPRINHSKQALEAFFEKKDSGMEEIMKTRLVWNTKVSLINKIAKGEVHLDVMSMMALGMYTNNSLIPRVLNSSLAGVNEITPTIADYLATLYNGLERLPSYSGEVYIGSNVADRKLFLKGQTFMWGHFVSGSAMWRVALGNVPNFTTKSRKGVMFIVKSKTGRHVGDYSQFSFDSEVIFLPRTVFKVTNWYHGDIIALGQENIREHTFGIKSYDNERMNLEQMIESDKSLIIELVEQ